MDDVAADNPVNRSSKESSCWSHGSDDKGHSPLFDVEDDDAASEAEVDSDLISICSISGANSSGTMTLAVAGVGEANNPSANDSTAATRNRVKRGLRCIVLSAIATRKPQPVRGCQYNNVPQTNNVTQIR